ncbi:MAG: hypothetical protein EBX41_08360, partial [Chitinophagia bacterium]|nr:hypothetical protein [Chitinophagia bacterium]
LYTQGPLIDYKVKGNKINFMGKKTIDGTECYKLKLTYLTTGIEEMVYIQTSNFYAIKYATTKQQDSTANEEILQYSNFKKLDGGLVFPMNIQSSAGNIVINSIEINKEIPESLFTPAINKP